MGLRARALLIGLGALFGGSSACVDEGAFVAQLPTVKFDQPLGQLRTVTSVRATQAEPVMIRFDYAQVDCNSNELIAGGVVASALTQTAPQYMTPGVPGLQDLPVDHGSRHRYSDHVQALIPGCFQVVATPVEASGEPMTRCKPAKRSKVVVEADQTEEIVLIHQCEGAQSGGLGALAILNHPPQIQDVSFESAQLGQCAQDIVACATATDPEGDPLRFEWEQIPGAAPTLNPGEVVFQSPRDPFGAHKECIRYRPESPGRYDIKVKVFDLAKKDGELVKFETITEEGHSSSDELDIPLYSTGEAGKNVGSKAPKPQGQTKSGILILESTVVGREESYEAKAARNVLDKLALENPITGKETPSSPETIDILSFDDWGKLSLEQFSRYRVIIMGDPLCGWTPPQVSTLWTAAVNGNVLIYGSNPSVHEKEPIIERAIAFAAKDETRTGAYISTSCYYHSAAEQTRVEWLGAFGEQGANVPADQEFRVVRTNACPHQVQVAASMGLDDQGNEFGFTDEELSNWSCSAHNYFHTWPDNFEPMALVINDEDSALETKTMLPGKPFVLARGAYRSGCGNGIIEPGEACDDNNRIDGDDCDRACHVEKCGDGLLQGLEYCDDGNTVDGDGCSSTCTLEATPCEP